MSPEALNTLFNAECFFEAQGGMRDVAVTGVQTCALPISVSLAGWGAGGLIGIALARAARAPSPSLGALAVVLTVGPVVVAKALILALALPPILLDGIVAHPETSLAVYVLYMHI